MEYTYDTKLLEEKLDRVKVSLSIINAEIDKLEKEGVTVFIEKINIHIDSQ